MGNAVINLFVLMAMGVMLANLIVHPQGTKALFDGTANLWKIGVNGMLGKTS